MILYTALGCDQSDPYNMLEVLVSVRSILCAKCELFHIPQPLAHVMIIWDTVDLIVIMVTIFVFLLGSYSGR